MSQHAQDLSGYFHLVHLTQDDQGNAVDLVAALSGLDEEVAVGFVYSAELKREKLRLVAKFAPEYKSKNIKFIPYGFIFWPRALRERLPLIKNDESRVELSCIKTALINSEVEKNDPELKSLPVTKVQLSPDISDGKTFINVKYSEI